MYLEAMAVRHSRRRQQRGRKPRSPAPGPAWITWTRGIHQEIRAAILQALAMPKAVPAGLDYFSQSAFQSRLHRIIDQFASIPGRSSERQDKGLDAVEKPKGGSVYKLLLFVPIVLALAGKSLEDPLLFLVKLHPLALVDPGAVVGARTRVWAFAHVCGGAVIGEDCNLCDHTFFEKGVRVGNRVTIKCGVYLWDGAVLEDDVFVGPCAVFTNDLRPRSRKYPDQFLKTHLREGCTVGANAHPLARDNRMLGDGRRRGGGHAGCASARARSGQPGAAVGLGLPLRRKIEFSRRRQSQLALVAAVLEKPSESSIKEIAHEHRKILQTH